MKAQLRNSLVQCPDQYKLYNISFRRSYVGIIEAIFQL